MPIGIIDSSRGGTPIEPFIPRAAFQSHSTLRRELELGDQGDLRGIWKLPGGVRARDANWLPGRLFHSRLAPMTRFAVRGAIWYQGESNCGDSEDPRDYQHKMRALITGWRTAIGGEKLPFYFVQLPGSGARAGWPYLREQQRLSTDLPHTGMVVTIDLLDKDIHPGNKIDVGREIAESLFDHVRPEPQRALQVQVQCIDLPGKAISLDDRRKLYVVDTLLRTVESIAKELGPAKNSSNGMRIERRRRQPCPGGRTASQAQFAATANLRRSDNPARVAPQP